jgi:hypothetical protein
VAKFLTRTLDEYINLANQYVVSSSVGFAHDLTKFDINSNHRFLTHDIKALFVNIPVQAILKMTYNFLQITDIDTTPKSQILQLMKTVLYKHYFIFSCNIYQPTKGIALGSPLSSIIAEIFFNLMKNISRNQKDNILHRICGLYLDYIQRSNV